MIKLSKKDFEVFIKKTFLEFLTEVEVSILYESLGQTDLESFQRVNREEPPQNLYFVYNGEILLRNRHTGQEFGFVSPGQSIDFKSLLLRYPQWQHDWFVEESAVLLKIPFGKLDQILGQYPNHLNYLSNLSQSVALQRFKRDMVALGFSHGFIRELITTFKLVPFKDFLLFEKRNSAIFTVAWGEVEVVQKNISNPSQIKTVKSGHTFVGDLNRYNYDFVAPMDTRLFTITQEDFQVFKTNPEFIRFIQLHGSFALPAEERLEQIGQYSTGPQAVRPKIQEDELVDSLEISRKSSVLENTWKSFHKKMKQSFLFQKTSPLAIEIDRSHFYIHQMLLDQFKTGLKAKNFSLTSQADYYDLDLASLAKELASSSFDISEQEFSDSNDLPFNDYCVVHSYRTFSLIRKNAQGLFELYDVDKGFFKVVSFHEIEAKLKNKKFIHVRGWAGHSAPSAPHFSLHFCWALIQDKKAFLALSFAVSIVSYILSLSFPIMTQYLMDQVIQFGRSDRLPTLTVMLILITLYSVFIDWYGQRLTTYFTNLLSYRLKSIFNTNLFQKQSYVPDSVFITRVTEIETLSQFYFSQYLPAFLNIFLMTFTLFIISLYSPLIAILLTGLLPISFLAIYVSRDKIDHIKSEYLKSKTSENHVLIQLFTHLESLKHLKMQLISRWKMEMVQSMTVQYLKKNTLAQSMLQVLQLFKTEAIRMITIVLSLKLYVNDQLTLGQVIALTMLAPRLGSQLQTILNAFFQYFSIRVLCDKLDDIFQDVSVDEAARPLDRQNQLSQKERNPPTEIAVNQLQFSYGSSTPKNVIQNLACSFKKGQLSCITGPTGSGKTTLAYLLSGLYEPQQGEIRYLAHGENVKAENIRIAMVEQSGRIFTGTILYNIAMDDTNPDLKKVSEIIHFLDAEDEFMQKPGGLSFQLIGQGVGLSPGQKNKILIARALYQDPDVLILDESTCYFDPITEVEFIKKIKLRMKKKILIMVSNKISTIMKADQIFYLKDGHISEQGQHADLIQEPGEYSQSIYSQLSLK